MGPAARIATSWCSGEVKSQGSYLGAFIGGFEVKDGVEADGTGCITGSYYDGGPNPSMMAKGTGSAGGSIAYAGIAGVEDMDNQDSFNGFDFVATWTMDGVNGSPDLSVFQPTAFQLWLEACDLPEDTDPLEDVNGVPAAARYVYGIEPMDSTTNSEGHPLVSFCLGADGTPVFELAPKQRPDDFGLVFSTLWSRSLSPWETVGEIRFSADNDGDDALCHPPVNANDEPCMFFKSRIDIFP